MSAYLSILHKSFLSEYFQITHPPQKTPKSPESGKKSSLHLIQKNEATSPKTNPSEVVLGSIKSQKKRSRLASFFLVVTDICDLLSSASLQVSHNRELVDGREDPLTSCFYVVTGLHFVAHIVASAGRRSPEVSVVAAVAVVGTRGALDDTPEDAVLTQAVAGSVALGSPGTEASGDFRSTCRAVDDGIS